MRYCARPGWRSHRADVDGNRLADAALIRHLDYSCSGVTHGSPGVDQLVFSVDGQIAGLCALKLVSVLSAAAGSGECNGCRVAVIFRPCGNIIIRLILKGQRSDDLILVIRIPITALDRLGDKEAVIFKILFACRGIRPIVVSDLATALGCIIGGTHPIRQTVSVRHIHGNGSIGTYIQLVAAAIGDRVPVGNVWRTRAGVSQGDGRLAVQRDVAFGMKTVGETDAGGAQGDVQLRALRHGNGAAHSAIYGRNTEHLGICVRCGNTHSHLAALEGQVFSDGGGSVQPNAKDLR